MHCSLQSPHLVSLSLKKMNWRGLLMADYLFTILDSRTLTNFSFSIPRSSQQNPCTQLPALSFDYPRTTRKRRKKALQISFLSNNDQEPTLSVPSSSNLDIISSHEHSDGSFIFRFGDPSEVVKDDILKESNKRVEEVGSEGKEALTVVKVVDGENEREVIVERIEREKGDRVINEAAGSGSSRVADEASEPFEKLLEDPKHRLVSASSIEGEKIEKEEESQELNETADVAETVVSIGSRSSVVTEEVNGSSEKLLDNPKHVHFPASRSNAEVEETERESRSQRSNVAVDISNLAVAVGSESIEVTDVVSEVSEKLKEPKDSKFPVSTSRSEVKKIERQKGSQGSNEDVDVANSVAIASDTSEVTDGVSESSEKLSEDLKEVQLPDPLSSAQVEDSSSSVFDIESIKHDEEIPSSSSVLDKSNDLENGSTYEEILDKERHYNKVLQSVIVKSDSDTEKEDNNRDQENTVENLEVLESSIPGENQDAEVVHKNVPEDSSKSHVTPLSILKEAEPACDEGAENDADQEFGEGEATEKLPMISNNLPIGTSKAEKSSNYLQSSDLLEASDHELTESKSTDLEAEANTNKLPISDHPEVSDHELIELKSTEFSLTSKQVPTSEFVLSSAAASLPHPSKVLTGGEDAFFTASQNWLGIADGAGQWSLEGTKPGVYALELMCNCEKIVSDGNRSTLTNPEEVLSLSAAKSKSHGSSTALVAYFDGQVLHVANIGDSGFIVLRQGAVHKKSSPMFHEFSFPVQIQRGDDLSQLSQGYEVKLDEGDIIVMATDGLFDNLYEQEIALIVSKLLEAGRGPKEMAEELVISAQEVGSSATARSPFADAAQAAGYVGYTGGKLDDVTVIVSLVQKAASNDP